MISFIKVYLIGILQLEWTRVHHIIRVVTVVVYRTNAVVSNVNVELDGQGVDVIKARKTN